uniref:TNF receptor superfamily member 6b n=1 Tax=Podarcis muralis TaxID=64176 RepID=A0A670I4T3_PODMU
MQLYSKRNPFRTLSEWVVLYVLLLGPPCSGSYPTYSRRDRRTNEVFVCKQCPPGTYVAEECTNDKDTVCQPCPALHYTQYWNYLKKCLYCNVFCNSLEEEVRPCNGTHNRACQCKAGYHSDLDFCIKHSSCPLGTGVAQLGNPQEDTTCILCPQGTFSDSVSSTEVCQPHQDCSKQGLAVNVPGNQFHDTFCTACKMSKANSTKDKADELLGEKLHGGTGTPPLPISNGHQALVTYLQQNPFFCALSRTPTLAGLWSVHPMLLEHSYST